MTEWEKAKERMRVAYLKCLLENQTNVKISVNLEPENKDVKGFKIWLN